MNNQGTQAERCSHCGVSLANLSVEGVCPRCMLSVSLSTQTHFTDGLTESSLRQIQERAPLHTPAEIAPHFPQLDILECLGRGGMGVVYKARQKTLNRLAALKILAPGKDQDPLFASRFEGEAKALAQLSHQNIVTIYDFGRTSGFFFLLMEFVDGANLREVLRGRPLSEMEALAIIPPLCDALQYAHDHGVVHQDIKPENLLLDKQGRLKIADFGIAKMIGGDPPAAPIEVKAMGTPHYMAPEQFDRPGEADHRADVYSVGVVLYELLTGELPSPGFEMPSRKTSVDSRLDGIVLRALNRDPNLRFQYASEVKTCIDTITQTNAPNSFGRKESKAGLTTAQTAPTTPESTKQNVLAVPGNPFPTILAGWLFILFAAASLIPATLNLTGFADSDGDGQARVGWGALTACSGIALLTGSRWWRVGALLASGIGLLAMIVPWFIRLEAGMATGMDMFAAGGALEPEPLFATVSATLVLITSIWVLSRSEIIRQLQARGSQPAQWSQPAIWAALLSAVALGFVPLLPAGLLTERLAKTLSHSSGTGITVLAVIAEISGMILGWHALWRNKAAAKKLTGVGLASFAVLSWPLLAMTIHLIRVAAVLQAKHPASFAAGGMVPAAVAVSFILATGAGLLATGWAAGSQGSIRFRAENLATSVLTGLLITSAADQLNRVMFQEQLVLSSTSENHSTHKGAATGNRIRLSIPKRHVAVFDFYLRNGGQTVQITNLSAILVAPEDRPLSGVIFWENTLPFGEDKDPPAWRVGVSFGSIPYPLARNDAKEFGDFKWLPVPISTQPIAVNPGEAVTLPIFSSQQNSPGFSAVANQALVRVRLQAIPATTEYRLTGGFAYTSTNYPAWLAPHRSAAGAD